MSFVFDESAMRQHGVAARPSFSLTAPLKRLGKHMRRALYASNGQVAMDRHKIHYDILMQDALRGVVRKVLQEAADFGLPGDHHFFVTFHTDHQGVQVSDRLKAKYPSEMTIVLQHQFWDLEVDETFFSVGLSFGGIPETLIVPFSALKSFVDPSVSFGLSFAEPEEKTEKSSEERLEEFEKTLREEKIISSGPEKAEAPSAPSGGADVVSLDAFRKKDAE